MLTHAQHVIDVSRYPVTAGLRAQRVALQVEGSQALPVGVIATRCGALAALIERGLAVTLAISA
jgi:hypothetical protein